MAATLKLISRLSLRQITLINHRCNFGITKLRTFNTSGCIFSLANEFETAQKQLNSLSDDPGNDVKLKIYALFKQSTKGKCTTNRPGMIDFVGRAKWDAWSALADMSQDDAMKEYISTVNSIAGSQSSTPQAAEAISDPTDDVVSEVKNNMHIIRLNRPTKKNALKVEMYDQIANCLEAAGKDDTSIAVLTGSGDYYCSGNDLSNFTNINPADIGKLAADGRVRLERFVNAFIDFPKPLVALVNGPAIGVSVTTLVLCDAVYASDRATFQTPFTILGQSAEGCSSHTFPKIMGYSKASEMLYFNKKLNAQEAMERNIISDIIPHDSFQQEAWKKVEEYAKLPKQSMQQSKKLVRSNELDILHKVNTAECQLLEKLWQSEECITAIMNFFQRKN